MSRKFFYVCAGLFLLAASFAVGAVTSTAQPVVGVADAGSMSCMLVGRQIIGRDSDFRTGQSSLIVVPDPVPGAGQVVAIHLERWNPGWIAWAVLEDGSVYQIANDSGGWISHGSVLGGPINTTQSTWGQVKARYR